jgi:hypothetical protein
VGFAASPVLAKPGAKQPNRNVLSIEKHSKRDSLR